MEDSSSSSGCSSISSPLIFTSPSKNRRPPLPLRIDAAKNSVEPKDLIGKVIVRIRRSPNHPVLTLDFSDNTTFQILVDGYDPSNPGVPKELEMDSFLDPIFNPPGGQLLAELTIVGCSHVTLTDKAFERKDREEHWDQNHLGIAFKFAEDSGRWHCIWVTLVEYSDDLCVFRSYDDVYLARLHRSKMKLRRKESPC